MATRTIHCWSGPRCCSTSFMYSWAQRPDCDVVDEPLYAAYLKLTGIDHPGRDEVLATYPTDGEAVLQDLEAPRGTSAKPLLYAKHIAKHKLACSVRVFRGPGSHILLVREPKRVVASFAKGAEPTQQELGYTALLEILSELRATGRQPLIVLSDELVREPEGVLTTLCTALGVPFMREMLSWPAGPKPYDGCWAPYWYANTHKSTGFSSGIQEPSDTTVVPPHLRPLLAECSVLYELLRSQPGVVRPSSGQVPRPLPSTSAPGSTQTSSSHKQHQQPGNSIPSSSHGAAADASVDGAQEGAITGGAQGHHGMSTSTSSSSTSATHAYVQDPRNDDVLIGIRDGVSLRYDLVWRPMARVSVLDSGYMLGDGVWEGLRLHKGVLVFAQEHFDRLWEGSKAIDMDLGVTKQQLADMVYQAVDANGMHDASGVHIRLMVTRGLKPTPYQSPYITIGKPTIVVIPEYKEAAVGPKQKGIRLSTVHVRRGAPDVQDPGWNSHSKLNCIAACIQAKKAGADEGLMLDPHGFVATCNSTNFFIVRKGEVWAPTGRYQMQGITRGNVLALCKTHGIPCKELDFSLTQVYGADEAFVTGTFAGLIPVVEVDGRVIGQGSRGPLVSRLQGLYMELVEVHAQAGRVPLQA